MISLAPFFRAMMLALVECGLVLGLAGCASAPVPPSTQSSPSATSASSVAASTAPSPTVPPRVSTSLAPAASPISSDWTMYHRDSARTGYLPDFPDPQRLAVAWNTALDGAVYAEPLVVGGHVIAATEGGSIYSLNASSGQVEWRTHIGDPVARAALQCGNIDPLGITGTPVYDPTSGLVFAVAEVSGPSHVLVGVDARTGEIKIRRSADPDGMQEPRAHQQRASLALSQGMVYVAYGGLFGDCGNYHGWVIASRTDGTGLLLVYQVPTQREGGIWAPPGPVIDANGRLFVSTGNGSATRGEWDHSDSVLRLSSALKLEDGFAPTEWAQENARDADLGSLGPVLLPGNLIFIAGKAGIGFVLHSDALGGVGGQAQTKQVCSAYGGAAVVGSTVFVPCVQGLQQVQIATSGNMTLGWRANGIPGSPVVGGHTVYVLSSGRLHALDVDSGRERANVSIDATSRFSTPTLLQNRVFVGTMSGVVAVTVS